MTNQALDFCRAYHGQYEATQRFVAELAERDLLTDNSTEIRLADDQKIQMQGYKVIDREKFEALDDSVFLEWRRKNWLPVAYAHMVSLSNWPAVLQRAADRRLKFSPRAEPLFPLRPFPSGPAASWHRQTPR